MKTQKTELTYSTTTGISRAGPALETLIVCIIQVAAFGENHPAIAQSLSSLAVLYSSMGNYAAAEPLYQKVLEIDRRILGEDHVDYARDLNNLAMLYRSTGNYAAAESLYVRALAIIGRAVGRRTPGFCLWSGQFGHAVRNSG